MEDETATEIQSEEQEDVTFEPSSSSCEPHLMNQGELKLDGSSLGFEIIQKQAELLSFRLKG